MPDLPGLTGLTQAQFDRVVAAFPGATAAEKTASYKAWLTNRVINQVVEVETQRAVAGIKASLPPMQPEPEFT